MRTYDKTTNIIDLTELRRRQALDRRDSLVRQTEERWVPEKPSGFRPVVLTATREELRRARRERWGWYLEACACMSLILTAAALALRILI